jgi:glycosyltransferase involved in cell wall biosynthesis
MPSEVRLIPAIYVGTPGKGSAIKAIFEAAQHLNVKSVALVDSDLRSITPEWMKLLITPTLNGTEFVSPLYNRRKYDGTITNFLCYPVTASLYGKKIRQPIGGDFGLSLKMVNTILNSPMWNYPDVHRFGIDIFETHTALSTGFEIKQALLGVKNHDPKDPSSQLASMFRQVISTMFTCIEQYEEAWTKVEGTSEVESVGDGKYTAVPDPVEVDFQGTVNAFTNNFDKYVTVYKKVLSNELLSKFEQMKKEFKNADLPSETWAKTVYSFAAKFHHMPPTERALIVDALRVLWIGRVAVFMKETWELDRDSAERKIIEEAQVFEKLKPYFTSLYFNATYR